MFSHGAILASLILPALALVAPRESLQERAGGAIGDVFAGAPISNITVKADNVAQCQMAYISWTGATDPVSLFIALGGFYVGETPITTLYDLRGGSTTWRVNQAAGQTMEFRVTDAKGAVAYVQNIKIAPGDAWCLESSSSTTMSSSSTTPAWTESPSSTWTPAAESTTTTSTAEAAPAIAAATTTSSTSTTTKTSTASTRSSTTTSTSSASTFAVVTPPATTTSANNTAAIAGAGAAASASRTGGATRDAVGGSGIAAALAACAMALGLTL